MSLGNINPLSGNPQQRGASQAAHNSQLVQGVGTFSAYLSANTTFAATTWTPIVFNTEDWDVSEWYNTSNGRYTPKVPGIYRLSTTLSTLNNGNETAATRHSASVYKNGSLYKHLFLDRHGDANYTFRQNGSVLVAADGNDYFDVRVYHTVPINGATNAGVAGGATLSFFEGEFVSNHKIEV